MSLGRRHRSQQWWGRMCVGINEGLTWAYGRRRRRDCAVAGAQAPAQEVLTEDKDGMITLAVMWTQGARKMHDAGGRHRSQTVRRRGGSWAQRMAASRANEGEGQVVVPWVSMAPAWA